MEKLAVCEWKLDMEGVAANFGIKYYHIPITKENKAEQEAKTELHPIIQSAPTATMRYLVIWLKMEV